MKTEKREEKRVVVVVVVEVEAVVRGAASLLQRGVVEQLLDEVDVAQQHAAAAVALQAQRVQRVAINRAKERETAS